MRVHRIDARRREHARSRGFTLLELLVVLGILVLIAAFAGPRVLKFLSGAKVDAAKVQLENIASTLDLYRLEVGRYPSEEEGLRALIEAPAGVDNWNGPYLAKATALLDPWGNPYRYRFPPERGTEYDLFSLGADNAEGGESENQDIVNW